MKTKKMYCKICEKATKHKHVGTQKFEHVSHELWNCTKCGGTRTE